MVNAAATTITPQTRRREITSNPYRNACARFMRLEFLYRQMLFYSELENPTGQRGQPSVGFSRCWRSCRAATCVAKSHKELDYQLDQLQRFQSQPGVDKACAWTHSCET